MNSGRPILIVAAPDLLREQLELGLCGARGSNTYIDT